MERTQAARSARTRRLLADFAAVGTEKGARAAGVTRGAIYPQFDDKTGLF